MDYSVIITTSGTGSRLGELTRKTNKALVPINGRPTIEYILDRYAKNIPLVVTVGYLADQVKRYLSDYHPQRNITFIDVDPYEGGGSSLGYSLLCAAPFVQNPFIFHACDTIVLDKIPAPDKNWAAGFRLRDGEDASSYRTQTIRNGRIIKLNEKGTLRFDLIHIGIIGIADFDFFWQTLSLLHSERSTNDTSLSDVHAIARMIADRKAFHSVQVKDWFDTGNNTVLRQSEQALAKQPSQGN